MKRRTIFHWCSCSVLAVLVAGPLTAGMDLVLETERQAYLLGELVSVTLKAENNSSEAVVTSVLLSPETGFVQFFVSDDGEEFRQYLGPGWSIRDVFLRPEPVEPGATHEVRIDLMWNNVMPGRDDFLRRNLAFDEERCYRVKASALLPEFDRESNTIEICMTPPTGRDLAVWNSFVAQPELLRFVQRPIAPVTDEVRARAQALLNQNPSSTYAPYLEKALREYGGRLPQVGR